ncbi:phosphopantetheine-binding protein [Kitasatospora sp. NPDC058048]|uniref:phosphopantetheine-binding protein n=1 Tax=Kitasatospora sp. NPDC058048 TaxID=3346313 RepID=UPI0036DDFF9C
MGNEWISVLLTNLLPADTVQLLSNKYEEYKDTPLTHIGLESMAVMGLVLRLSSEFGREVDYEEFDLDEVSTLGKIKTYLEID